MIYIYNVWWQALKAHWRNSSQANACLYKHPGGTMPTNLRYVEQWL